MTRGRGSMVLSLVIAGCAGAADLPPPGAPAGKADATLPAIAGGPTDIEIEAGEGNAWYAYSPSVAQLSPGSRRVFFCGDSIVGELGEIQDHVMVSDGAASDGTWTYSPAGVAFGADDAPELGTHHVCDPSHVRGSFGWDGHVYEWAILFTALHQVGVAFADTVDGPWHVYPQLLITTEMEPAASGVAQHPTAISVDRAGTIWLFYKLGSGPEVIRTVDLSEVASPVWLDRVEIPDSGLPAPGVFRAASFALDDAGDRFLVATGTGPFNHEPKGPNVHERITIAALDRDQLLGGSGTWQVMRTFGVDVSGQTYNHNAGFVRDRWGALPDADVVELLFTVADPSIPHGNRGVFQNRLWWATMENEQGLLPGR